MIPVGTTVIDKVTGNQVKIFDWHYSNGWLGGDEPDGYVLDDGSLYLYPRKKDEVHTVE